MFSYIYIPLCRILKLLVEKNLSSVSCKDTDGNTPLHLACHEGLPQVVDEFLICSEGKNNLKERYIIQSVCKCMQSGDLYPI